MLRFMNAWIAASPILRPVVLCGRRLSPPPPSPTGPSQVPSIQHDVVAIGKLAGAIAGPLVHVALDWAFVTGVLAGLTSSQG